MTEENWLDAQQQTVYTISYSYDAAGRVLSASDDAATYEYEYDKLGRVIEETQTLAGLTPVIVFCYQYSLAEHTNVSTTQFAGDMPDL